MTLLKSDKLTEHLQSIIHKETQQHENHFDLTVDHIHKITEAGSLDFGGGEFQPADFHKVEPQKDNEGDKYGWWHLSGGTYRATMNEELRNFQDTTALLAAHTHAQKAGIITNSMILSGKKEINSITMNFTVPEAGCNIKENARFAVLYLLAN